MSQRYLGGIITANPTLPTLSSASGVWTLEQDFQNSASITPQVIGRSVRLRSSASAYLTRTLSVDSTSQTKMTWSGWVKRGALGSALRNCVFYVGNSAATSTIIFAEFYNDTFRVLINGGGTVGITTTQIFRDPSAWYHIVFAYDSTQATSSDRMKLYVNGVQVTAFSSAAYPALNATINNVATTIQQFANVGSILYDGYLAEQYFIDGQGLPASSFGAFDSNGIWQPLSYRGTYGANGFYLTFADNSASTATTLGKDYSGNGNNFTPNNISVTSGVTYDSMLDVPTNSSDGGNGRGNYCTLNPLWYASSFFTLSNANLTFAGSGTTTGSYVVTGTWGLASSKWYWEVTPTDIGAGPNIWIGIQGVSRGTSDATSGVMPGTGYSYSAGGSKMQDATITAYAASYAAGDVIGVALDLDSGTLTFYKNGVSQGTAFTGISAASTPTGAYTPAVMFNLGGVARTIGGSVNFGQRPFSYTPPTGFLALNTQNLPAVTINNGAQYMAATTYTGTGATQSISNGANNPIATTFQPDLIWFKSRSNAADHGLFDSVRGRASGLASNTTGAEQLSINAGDNLVSFNSNGFTVGSVATVPYWNSTNANGYTEVAWQWKAGGTAVSNTSGSITSQVSANTTAGFSVVTYTGNSLTNQTVGHGLGVAPKMVIIKNRDFTWDWIVGHASASFNGYLFLNSTGTYVSSSNPFNNTSPSSTVFTIAGNAANTYVNFSAAKYVAYCFSEVAGYSKFGSYTGNGSTDGPFVYCGFRPRWVMIKPTVGTGSWQILDTARDTYNVEGNLLWANESTAETSSPPRWDCLSNGFKVRAGAGTHPNVSNEVYIYAAFAENPFNVSRAR